MYNPTKEDVKNNLNINYYKEDSICNPYIYYMINDSENKNFLISVFGEPLMNIGRGYLEININNFTWWSTHEYRWLYKNQPNLSSINDIKIELRFKKIKKIKNNYDRN